MAPLFAASQLRYVIVADEVGCSATGAREDWENLPHKAPGVLGRYGQGRTGAERHQLTVFWRR